MAVAHRVGCDVVIVLLFRACVVTKLIVYNSTSFNAQFSVSCKTNFCCFKTRFSSFIPFMFIKLNSILVNEGF